MNWKSYIPIFEWLPQYRKSDIAGDLVAGLTVGIMLIPQGMAYALLAGMPPIYGLYASILPLIIYGIFGTSRQLSVGPVAISALLILAGISQVATPGSDLYIELVILTGLLVGIAQFLMGAFRLGFLVNFLSHPVIAGFTSAAAVIISINQFKYILGIDVPRFTEIFDTCIYCLQHLYESKILTLVFGLGGILLMLLLKRIHRNIPAALIAIILGILLTTFLNLDAKGLAIVGDIPSGLPAFYLPELSLENIKLVLPTVFTVSLIGVVECIGIAKAIESKHNYYRVIPNQELRAIGLSKIGGAFFQALPTSGSFSRSAINDNAGGKTGISSIITALLIIITLLFLTPLFYHLPEAILAAIILLAVRNLFEWKTAVELWKHHRADFWMMLATFIITLSISIEAGILTGIGLSVATLTFKSSQPHIAVVGKLPQTTSFRNVERFTDAKQYEGVLMVRFDAHLYFTNATYFKDTLSDLVAEQTALEVFILDASSMHAIDASGMQALDEFYQFLVEQKVQFYITGVLGPVRDLFYQNGFFNKIGEMNHFINLNSAIEFHLHREDAKRKYWLTQTIKNKK
ncbi:MAG: SulP family inorganic anion transporter [Saprospiraceae bacterium]